MDKDTNKKIKILLIDDEKLLRIAYRDGLSQAGMTVVEAENGKIAMEKLQNESKPDLIMLDLIMPEMDGFAVLEAISRKPELKKIPVVVLTVSGHSDDLSRSKKMGAVDYLIKTDYSMSEIINRIKFHLADVS